MEDDEMFENEPIVTKDDQSAGAAICEVEDGDAGLPNVFRKSAPVTTTASRPDTLTTDTAPGVQGSSAKNCPSSGNCSISPSPSPALANTFRASVSTGNISGSSAPLKIATATSPLDSFRSWSSSTLVFARQYVGEHLGRRGRSTADPDLTTRVNALVEQQRQYVRLLKLATTLTAQMEQVVRTQRALGDALGELSQGGGNVALGEQFSCSADTMKVVSRNGESLLAALNMFKQSLTTLCNTTIEDTLATVKHCDTARIKYDAYRLRVDDLKLHPARDASSTVKLREAEAALQLHKHKYDRIHGDLAIKLKFLEENKVMVCQKHLYLLHKAFMNYISGNQLGVDDITKHCHFAMDPTPVLPSQNNHREYPTSTVLPSSNNHQDSGPIAGSCQ